jgi:hypothetical protein
LMDSVPYSFPPKPGQSVWNYSLFRLLPGITSQLAKDYLAGRIRSEKNHPELTCNLFCGMGIYKVCRHFSVNRRSLHTSFPS